MVQVMGCGDTNASASPLAVGEGVETVVSVVAGQTKDTALKISATYAAEWQEYTPTSFNFSIGSGVAVGRYLWQNLTLSIRWLFRFAGDSTFDVGGFETNLPFGLAPFQTTNNIVVDQPVMGSWTLLDASTGNNYEGEMHYGQAPTANPMRFRYKDDITGALITDGLKQGTPIAIAANDVLVARAVLEVV
jgi:hypothetical protein